MTSVTQTYVHVQWATHELQISIWTQSFENHICLYGNDSIPSMKINGNHVMDAMGWLQDKHPSYIDMWREELSIYKEVTSQIDLPVLPASHTGRTRTYKLPLCVEDAIITMFVEVMVRYKELAGPLATGTTGTTVASAGTPRCTIAGRLVTLESTVSLYITCDDDPEVHTKTLVSHYSLPLPINIQAVREVIQPGIAYLADSIRKVTL